MLQRLSCGPANVFYLERQIQIDSERLSVCFLFMKNCGLMTRLAGLIQTPFRTLGQVLHAHEQVHSSLPISLCTPNVRGAAVSAAAEVLRCAGSQWTRVPCGETSHNIHSAGLEGSELPGGLLSPPTGTRPQ